MSDINKNKYSNILSKENIISRRSVLAASVIASTGIIPKTLSAAHHGNKKAKKGSRDLMLLVYTPREDSNSRGYDEWLQEIDNPFFNGIEGIKHYTNWKVSSVADCAFPYTHFDFMYLDDADSKDKVWGNPEVAKFAQGWTESWGRYPKATAEEMQKNYQVYLCSHVSGDKDVKSNDVAFMPSINMIPSNKNQQVYEVSESVLGDIRFKYFSLSYMENAMSYSRVANNRPSETYGVAHGSIIASPDI